MTKEERLEALADRFGVKEADIEVLVEKPFEVLIPDTDTEDSGSYFVLTKEEARKEAEDYIKSVFDDSGIDSFTKDFKEWVIENAVYDDYLLDIIKADINDYYHVLYDEEIIDTAIERGIIDGEEAYDDGEIKLTNTEIEDLADALTDYDIEEVTQIGPVNWIIDNYGVDHFNELINDNDIIDMDKVVDRAIALDGLAHFLASYDGEEIALGHDLYAYRLD